MTSQATDNRIPSAQNLPLNLKRLAAQRQLYSKAKRLLLLQLVLDLPIIGALSGAAFWLNRPARVHPVDLSWLVAVAAGAIVLAGRPVLASLVEGLQETAAKLQEEFDTTVLRLDWNAATAGDRADPESIHTYSERYKKRDPGFKILIDWYSPQIAQLPDHVGRIVCQRANLVWDVGLRERFSLYLGLAASLLFILLFTLAAWDGLSLRVFLLGVVAPTMPIAVFTIDQKHKNGKAASNLTRLKQIVEAALEEAKDPSATAEQLTQRARQVQDSIYYNRKDNPLIFDWFYRIHRDTQEASMRFSVDQFVDVFQAPSRAG